MEIGREETVLHEGVILHEAASGVLRLRLEDDDGRADAVRAPARQDQDPVIGGPLQVFAKGPASVETGPFYSPRNSSDGR